VIAAAAGNWDRRLLLAAGMTVFAVGIVLQAVGTSFAVVAAGRVVAALGAAGYQATAYSTAGILSDDAHRARALAVVAGGSSVAIVAGLPFGLLVGQLWGWRAAMWLLLGLAVVSLLAIGLLPAAHTPRLTLRQRGAVLGDRRVLGVLAGTVAVLTPGFLVLAYLPAILHTSGMWIVFATLAYGAGQVAGTTLVPRLIDRVGARRTLQFGAIGITAISAALTVTRTAHPVAIVTMAALGLAVGLTIVPQQHRLFASVPDLAPIAVGLNGSAIYVGSALGAAVGGLTVSVGGGDAPTIAAAVIGVVAIVIASAVRVRARVAATG
jgi:predicted MFS family arabinose efflux permease